MTIGKQTARFLIGRHEGQNGGGWECGTLQAQIKRILQGNQRFRSTPNRI